MRFIPENKKTRQMILIGGLIALGLFAFGFFYVTYFIVEDVEGIVVPKRITEEVVRQVDRDISDIQQELEHEFYKNLKKLTLPRDTKNPGNTNPFSE